MATLSRLEVKTEVCIAGLDKLALIVRRIWVKNIYIRLYSFCYICVCISIYIDTHIGCLFNIVIYKNIYIFNIYIMEIHKNVYISVYRYIKRYK